MKNEKKYWDSKFPRSRAFIRCTHELKVIARGIRATLLPFTHHPPPPPNNCPAPARLHLKPQDVKQLNTSEKAYYGLRLDYKDANNPFTPSSSDYFIRFTTKESNNVSLPTSTKYPNTGHGFTSGANGNLGVPELQLNNWTNLDNAAIYKRTSNGQEELVAVFGIDKKTNVKQFFKAQ